MFRKLNINLVFSYKNTILKNLICNTPKTDRGIIYQIKCSDCDMFYIGETGRDLDTRVREHRRDVETQKTSNAIFLHKSSKDHSINWQSAKALIKNKDWIERNLIETSLICFSKDKNFNTSPGLFNLDPIMYTSICDKLNLAKILN